MQRTLDDDGDRRVRRTRAAIFAAFLRLVLARRYETIRTGDLIAEADVGRSTFYEHFRGKDDVLVAIVDPIFAPLADAASGRGGHFRLLAMLDHVWEQRALARLIFDPARLPRLQRKLAAMIEARLEGEGDLPPIMAATAAAAAQLALLRLWLAGEAACPAEALARHLMTECRAPVPLPRVVA